jgi:hypothetical protein
VISEALAVFYSFYTSNRAIIRIMKGESRLGVSEIGQSHLKYEKMAVSVEEAHRHGKPTRRQPDPEL